jgi:hypothetical protein
MMAAIPALLKGVIRRQTDGGAGSGARGQVLSRLRSGDHGIPPLGTTTQRLGTL